MRSTILDSSVYAPGLEATIFQMIPSPLYSPLATHLLKFHPLPIFICCLTILLHSLRGVPGSIAKEMAGQLLDRVGLPTRDADLLCGAYSGGNRRKLAVAVALVGLTRDL